MKSLLFLLFIAAGAAACGAGNDACEGFSCDSGFSCLLQNGEPICVPNGTGGNAGGNGAGEQCETDNDCQESLVCGLDVISGTLVCQAP